MPVDVQTILTEALKAIENANVPTELRVVAFGKAVDLVAPVAREEDAPLRPRKLDEPLVGDVPLVEAVVAEESQPLRERPQHRVGGKSGRVGRGGSPRVQRASPNR